MSRRFQKTFPEEEKKTETHRHDMTRCARSVLSLCVCVCREMTVRGDIGDFCKTQREESCILGSDNGQIFLVHPPDGRLHLRNIILQDGYRNGEAFFIGEASFGPEASLVEMYEKEMKEILEGMELVGNDDDDDYDETMYEI